MAKEIPLDMEEDNLNKKLFIAIVSIVLILILVILFFNSWYTIPAGYRGVVLTFNKPSELSTGEGLHFKLPIIQSVIKMDTRTQKYESDLTAASSDLQDVYTKIAINYHLSSDSVVEVYRSIGIDYADKIIVPLEQESNKASTAEYVAADLVKKREEVRKRMENLLREKLSPKGIIVESISIVDFKYSPSFSAAIENKVTQEQNALAAKNKLEQIKYEAEQRITQAKGEADAIAIQAQAINSQGGKDYVQLQGINKWNGQLPNVMLSNGATPFVDITGMTQ